MYLESAQLLHGTLKSDVTLFQAQDVRNIFYCSIDGILVCHLFISFHYLKNSQLGYMCCI